MKTENNIDPNIDLNIDMQNNFRKSNYLENDSNPVFSIIVPVYGHAHLVGDALDSLLQQTFSNWEAIVVDGGSTDNSLDIIKQYSEKDNRIRIFANQNGVTASALNHGLSQTRGEWILQLSPDGLFEPSRLDILLQNIVQQPNIDFFHTHFFNLNDETRLKTSPELEHTIPETTLQVVTLFDANYVHGNSIAVRRKCFDEVGNFNEKLQQGYELDMWLRLSARYKSHFINERTCVTRFYNAQDTITFSKGAFFDSTQSCYNFLLNNAYEELFPFSDLTNAVEASLALEQTLRVALHLNAIMYNAGYNTILLERLAEWLSLRATENVKANVTASLKYLPDQLKHLNYPVNIKNMLDILADITNIEYVFSPKTFTETAKEHVAFLEDNGKSLTSEALNLYLDSCDNAEKNGHDINQFNDISINIPIENSEWEEVQTKSQPETCVVIPCYNYAEFLPAAVESLNRQTYKDFEVVIVNDGSTDDTENVASELALKYPHLNIRIINQLNSGKPSISRNNGLKATNAEFAMCLDADDWLAPTYLEKCTNLLKTATDVSIAYTDQIHVTITGAYPQPSIDYDFELLKIKNLLPTSAVFRRIAWLATGGYRNNVNGYEDWDFWIALGAKGFKGCRIAEALYYYRIHGDSLTSVAESMDAELRHLITINNREVYPNERVAEAIEYFKIKNTSSPLVSVVIPCYNQAHYLENAVKSVALQTLQNCEIIIVNDGSIDETSPVVNELIEKYPYCRIKLIEQENCGLANARNTGISKSSGKYIFPLDADDEIESQMLNKTSAILDNQADISIVYTDVQEFGDSCRLVPSIDFNFAVLCQMNYITASALYRKEVWERVGGYKEIMRQGYEDWEFWLSAAEIGFIACRIPEPLFLYRKHIGSMVHTDSLKNDKQLKAKIIELHPHIFSNKQRFWAKLVNDGNPEILNADVGPYIPIFDDYITPRAINTSIKYDNSQTNEIRQEFTNIVNKKMKILFTMYGWNETGGGTTYPKSIAIELVRRGYDVAVFFASLRSDNGSDYSLEELNDSGVRLYGLYNRPAIFIDPDYPEREICDDGVLGKFREVLDREKPDIVHFHNFHGLTLAMAEEVNGRGIRSCYTPHNYHLIDPNLYLFHNDLSLWNGVDMMQNSEAARRNPSKSDLYRKRIDVSRRVINEWIDLTLAVSTRQKELLVQHGGNPDRIAVVHQSNQANDELWKSKELANEAERNISSPLKVVFIGGVMPHKGVHVIAAAAQYFMPGDIEFHIFGFVAEQYLKILKTIDQKGLLQFHGEYRHDALSIISRMADIAIVPSLWEDCAPLVLLELEAMRLPVIAAKIGGIPDFISYGVNGLLYQYDSIESLVKCLMYAMANPEVINNMRHNMIQRHSFADYMNHLEYIYENIYKQLHESKPVHSDEFTLTIEFDEASEAATTERFEEIINISPDEDSVRAYLARAGFELLDYVSEKNSIGEIILTLKVKANNPVMIEEFFNAKINSTFDDSIDEESHENEIYESDKSAATKQVFEKIEEEIIEVIEEAQEEFEETLAEEKLNISDSNISDENRGDENISDSNISDENRGDENISDSNISDENDNPIIEIEKNMELTVPGEPIAISNYVGLSFEIPKVEHKAEHKKFSAPSLFGDEVVESKPPFVNIIWEGSQFVYHSLALINRENCANILDSGVAELTIIPYEQDQFSPIGNAKYEKLLKNDIRYKEPVSEEISKLPYIWIRHQWPPKQDAPQGARWIIYQPWEFSQLRKDFAELFAQADEIWTPSTFSRQSFIDSGLDFNKVQVIPNGINPDILKPFGEKMAIDTKKRFKFLFVGGTIFRKGTDVLIRAFLRTFTKQDDVCLVIKDMGSDTFYQGQTMREQIAKVNQTAEAPEIIYLDDSFTEEEMASLYRACDIFTCSYRGEGFSLPTLEAMACGLPVIVTQGGSTDDFVTDSTGWFIPSVKRSLGSTIDGHPLTGEAYILEPNELELMKIMRNCFDNPYENAIKGIIASRTARTQWTWRNSTLKLLSRLDTMYNLDLAIKADAVLHRSEDESIVLGEAEEELSCQQYDSAIELYKIAALGKNISDKYKLIAHLRLAQIYLSKKDISQAEIHLEKASLLTQTESDLSDQIDINYFKAKVHSAKKEWIESMDIFTKIFENWSAWKRDTLVGVSHDDLLAGTAEGIFETGDSEGALNLFTEALKINPQNAEACLGAGKCLIAAGLKDDARKMLEWAVNLDPMLVQARELLKGL